MSPAALTTTRRHWRGLPAGVARISVRITAAALLMASTTWSPAPLAAQGMPFDTASLGEGPGARACMLMERTIFKVDVLTLYVRFGPETAAAIRRLVDRNAPRDSIADVATRSRDAFARIEFVRDVGMDRFFDGVREDLRRAVRAGLVSQETFDEVSTGLPTWYSFLAGRDVREGDQVLYRISGDTLRSGYLSAGGEMLLDQIDVGPQRRLSVLGAYFVEGSSFRDGLLDGLVHQENDC
jgi:hypothetical protein